MFCSNCGKQIAENDKFCCGCGSPVETAAPCEPEPVCEADICEPSAAPVSCECAPEKPAEQPCCECAPEDPAVEPCCDCAPEEPAEEPCCDCAPEDPAVEPCCECAPEEPAEKPHDTTAYPAYDFGQSAAAASEPESESQQVTEPETVPEPQQSVYAPESVYTPEAAYVMEEPVCEQPAPQYVPGPVNEKNGLRVLLGVLLIIFAAARYVLPFFVNFNTNTIIAALMYSQEHYSVVSAFKSLLGMAEPLFYFTAAVATLAAGCALLMKHRGSAKLLKASVVINIIAIAFGLVCAALLYFAPGIVIRLLGGNNTHAELAKLIMEEIPQVLLYLMNPAVFHVAMCIVALIVSVVIMSCAKSAWSNTEICARDNSVAILVIPYVMAVAKIAVLFVERYVLMREDSLYITVSSLAQSLVSSDFGIYILAFALVAVAFSVFGRKIGALPLGVLWAVVVAAAAAVVITGAHDTVYSYLRNYGIGVEYYSIISNAFMAYAGVTAIWLIGLGIWMIASARGAFPVWVQILLGVVMLAVYAALEFVRSMTGLAFYIQLGSAGVLIVAIIASCVGVSIVNRREEYSYTAPDYEGVVIEEDESGENSPF